MTDLPQVGQKYQHKKWGEVEVVRILKRGRGYTVDFNRRFQSTMNVLQYQSLKDFQRATA